MRGNLRQRSKGSSTLTLSWREDGRLVQNYHTVKGTKRKAETKLNELIHQVNTGEYSPPDKTTVRAFLERWLKDYVWRKENLSPETAQVYQIIIEKHLIPALGSIALQKLTGDQIESYYTDKLVNGRRDDKGGLSPPHCAPPPQVATRGPGVRCYEEPDSAEPCRSGGAPQVPPEGDENI